MPNLKNWRIREIDRMKSDMEELFASMCSDFGLPVNYGQDTCSATVHMDETDSDIIIVFSLPCVTIDDVDLSVTDEALSIACIQENTTSGVHRSSRYESSIVLPAKVLPDKAEANFKDGVLRVTLPKDQNRREKRIRIQLT